MFTNGMHRREYAAERTRRRAESVPLGLRLTVFPRGHDRGARPSRFRSRTIQRRDIL